MEVGNKNRWEQLRHINRVTLALLLSIGGAATLADCSGNALAQRNNKPVVGRTVGNPQATTSTVANSSAATFAPETTRPRRSVLLTTSTSSPNAPATSTSEHLQKPSTTTSTTAVSKSENENDKIRKWVGDSLPADGLALLPVSPSVRDLYPDDLFVTVEGTNCGAVTEFTSESNGKEVNIENVIFAHSRVFLGNALLRPPSMRKAVVGDGDTDAAAVLGRNPVEVVPRSLPDMYKAMRKLTSTVCDQIPASR